MLLCYCCITVAALHNSPGCTVVCERRGRVEMGEKGSKPHNSHDIFYCGSHDVEFNRTLSEDSVVNI